MFRAARRTGGAILATIALVTAACGGDDSASVETVPPTSSTTTTTVATTTTVETTTTTTTEAPELVGTPAFDESSTVSTVGIDRVQFGMTLLDAERTLGADLVEVEGSANGDCVRVRPGGGPAGVELTVTAGTIERVDVSTPEITTRSGAGVGTTEAELFELFGDRLTSEPRAGGGNDIVFTPVDPGDAAFRVIFETDGTVVTRFRSGRVPQVEPSVSCTA